MRSKEIFLARDKIINEFCCFSGDNFGVQIQEGGKVSSVHHLSLTVETEVLAEVHRAQESAYNLRDFARQNHINRAKICSKLIKYPHVEDYKVVSRLCIVDSR